MQKSGQGSHSGLKLLIRLWLRVSKLGFKFSDALVFLFNFILRFAPGNQKFQPYFGAGVGVYFAESAGTEVVDPTTGTVPINTGGGQSHADLAFDVVAGSDYFFTPNVSAFIEYKFLDDTSTQIDTNHNRALGQQLLGAGVRYFFH